MLVIYIKPIKNYLATIIIVLIINFFFKVGLELAV